MNVALHAWSDMVPTEFGSGNWAPIEWRNVKDAEQEVLNERLAGDSRACCWARSATPSSTPHIPVVIARLPGLSDSPA